MESADRLFVLTDFPVVENKDHCVPTPSPKHSELPNHQELGHSLVQDRCRHQY